MHTKATDSLGNAAFGKLNPRYKFELKSLKTTAVLLFLDIKTQKQ